MEIQNRSIAEYSQAELKDIQKEFTELKVITQTFYGNDETSKVRQQLALKLFKNAKKLGLKVLVVDGGSNAEFLEKVKSEYSDTVELHSESEIPETDREPNGKVGMGTGRRFGFKEAAADENSKYFLWTEPEKDELLTVDNVRSMLKSLKNNEADIVTPKRVSQASMVPIQSWIETWANKVAAKTLATEKIEKFDLPVDETTREYFQKRPLDLWFGPKVFNRKGAEEFINFKGKLNKWDSNIAPVPIGELKGLKVNSVDVSYNYDPSQVKNETGNKAMDGKRWDQFLSILAELGNKDAARLYSRVKGGEAITSLVPEILNTFGMDEDMPKQIKEYLGL